MLKKIRELKNLLLQSGFTCRTGKGSHTHGDTYEEALKNAQEVLEMLISSYLKDGQTLAEAQILGKSLTAA